MRGIHDDSGVFFTSAPVNPVLYHMLILIHQQHIVVDGAVSCVLLQMSSLIMYLMDPLFSSFSFFQLVSITLYLIIIYVSLVIMSLCRLSILTLALSLSLIHGPLYYCLISSMSVLVLMLFLGLSLMSCFACVLLLNSTYSILCHCLYFTMFSLVSLLLFGLLYTYFFVLGLYATPQFTL